MLTKEFLASLRGLAQKGVDFNDQIAVGAVMLAQMIDICEESMKLAVRCVDCGVYASPENPDLRDVDLAKHTMVCPSCQKRRDRVRRANEPSTAGTFWHKCNRGSGGEPDWHPVEVGQNGSRLLVYHMGSDEDCEIENLQGEWGAEIIPPA